MQRVAFAGEPAGEVRITFPITEVRTLYRAITAGSETTVRQCVRQDVLDRFLQFSAAGEISASVRRIAPYSIFRPVPCRHAKLSIVAVGDRSPACGESLLNDVWCIDFVDAGAR